MKVVLLKNSKWGRSFEVKELSPGLVRNILIPQGLAAPATPDNLKKAEQVKLKTESEQKREEELAQEIFNKLNGLTVEVMAHAGPEGQLFSKLTAEDVTLSLERTHHFKLNPAAITLPQPIKHIGLHNAKARLTGEREAQFTVLVSSN